MSNATSATTVAVKAVIDRVMDIFYYSGNILEILVCIIIVSHFVKRNHQHQQPSPLASSYFYILFWGYIIDALFELGFTCQRYFTKDWDEENIIDLPFFKYFVSFIEWYIWLFLGPSTLLLSLNRFTSICYVTQHEKLWTKWFPLILLLLLSYPGIVGG